MGIETGVYISCSLYCSRCEVLGS